MAKFRQLTAWTVPGGLFHWINAVCILLLMQLGFILMFREDLGLVSVESKVALKYIHSTIGFVFLANLLIRAVVGVINKPRSVRQSSLRHTRRYSMTMFSSKRPSITEVRPASRWVTLAMFAMLTVSASTGLVRAGTDLFLPPIGPLVTNWVAESPESAGKLDPLSKEHFNRKRLNQLNQIKIPFGRLHQLSAWALLILIVIHVRMAADFSSAQRNTSKKSVAEEAVTTRDQTLIEGDR